MIHFMKVKTKYYNLLKSGGKVIELRLYDEKRQKIKVGDEINFSDTNNPDDNFNAKVINLHKAENFEKLCQIINIEDAGFDTQTELLTILEKFYSKSAQEKYGVVGIEIKKI